MAHSPVVLQFIHYSHLGYFPDASFPSRPIQSESLKVGLYFYKSLRNSETQPVLWITISNTMVKEKASLFPVLQRNNCNCQTKSSTNNSSPPSDALIFYFFFFSREDSELDQVWKCQIKNIYLGKKSCSVSYKYRVGKLDTVWWKHSKS